VQPRKGCASERKLIAKMLGVASEEVTSAATALGATGAIDYRDGRISLVDRAVLEQTSCECYQVVKRECDRLLPPASRSNC
jgi:Mn-dependent DtxR family transcriptional regulator